MTVGELRKALGAYPDDAPLQIHMERLPAENEEAFVVNVHPNYAGWSDRKHKPHAVLYAEQFPTDWIQVTRDRVVERARMFPKWDWPYGRYDWWNAPLWKRTLGRGRKVNA
jgi:hypothetical protein